MAAEQFCNTANNMLAVQVPARVIPYGICTGKVALGKVILLFIRYVPVNIISPWLSILVLTSEDEKRHSET
jgi:hypothetical protein